MAISFVTIKLHTKVVQKISGLYETLQKNANKNDVKLVVKLLPVTALLIRSSLQAKDLIGC